MHQLIRCQIARGIHCSTEHAEYHHCSTSRRGEEPSAMFSSTSSTTTRNWMEEHLHSYFILKCDREILNTFGSLRGFSHVIMEVDCMEHPPQFSLNSGSYPVTNRSTR